MDKLCWALNPHSMAPCAFQPLRIHVGLGYVLCQPKQAYTIARQNASVRCRLHNVTTVFNACEMHVTVSDRGRRFQIMLLPSAAGWLVLSRDETSTYSLLFYAILFYSILFYSILFYVRDNQRRALCVSRKIMHLYRSVKSPPPAVSGPYYHFERALFSNKRTARL